MGMGPARAAGALARYWWTSGRKKAPDTTASTAGTGSESGRVRVRVRTDAEKRTEMDGWKRGKARGCPTCGKWLPWSGVGGEIPEHTREASILYNGRREDCPASGLPWPVYARERERL